MFDDCSRATDSLLLDYTKNILENKKQTNKKRVFFPSWIRKHFLSCVITDLYFLDNFRINKGMDSPLLLHSLLSDWHGGKEKLFMVVVKPPFSTLYLTSCTIWETKCISMKMKQSLWKILALISA